MIFKCCILLIVRVNVCVRARMSESVCVFDVQVFSSLTPCKLVSPEFSNSGTNAKLLSVILIHKTKENIQLL